MEYKFGKPFVQQAKSNLSGTVNVKVRNFSPPPLPLSHPYIQPSVICCHLPGDPQTGC